MSIDYERLTELGDELSLVGFEPHQINRYPYYCTPKDANILGWAGVDGIHYCTVPKFGEMIFSVNPMDFGDCVHPIARNLQDLLEMLLFCGDMAAIEQCYAWDEEQFKAYLLDCPATNEQKAVLDKLKNAFSLTPMQSTFEYIKALQAEFDLSEIEYTEDYYDEDMNPAVQPATPTEWRVTCNGGFLPNDGEPGKEITVNRDFMWGEEKWKITAVYLCDDGVVMDAFKQAEPEELSAYIDKWAFQLEYEQDCTEQQREEMAREHPLNVDFNCTLILNDGEIGRSVGYGLAWIPPELISDGEAQDGEAEYVLEHYGLDRSKGWMIARSIFPAADIVAEDISGLSVRFEREEESITARRFLTPDVGGSVTVTDPFDGHEYTVTVIGNETQELPEHAFGNSDMEYPRCMCSMSYSVSPEIEGGRLFLRDCAPSDSPRARKKKQELSSEAAVIGIIGGADGPTAVSAVSAVPRTAPSMHCAVSSLHYEPPKNVEWRAVFRAKTMEDITVNII